MVLSNDALVEQILEKYHALNHKPTNGSYTILAALALTSLDPDLPAHIIALATGCKCLPRDSLPEQGEALHDSHAEVLVRRSALRWCLEETGRSVRIGSQWLARHPRGTFRLADGVRLIMYISTPPCKSPPARDPSLTSPARRRRVHALYRVPPRRGDGGAQGRVCVRDAPRRRRGARPRQLRPVWRAADQARPGGLPAYLVHVVQRQDRAVERARYPRRPRVCAARPDLHLQDHPWRSATGFTTRRPGRLRESGVGTFVGRVRQVDFFFFGSAC